MTNSCLQAHGFKSVKFLQHIRLTNDYRPNDTYAAIDEGDEGNDPGSVQKTYTIVDQMRGAPAIPRGGTVRLSGVLTNGRTPCMYPLDLGWVLIVFTSPAVDMRAT